MAFPKKIRWNMTFLVLSLKMIFPFPEIMILLFKQKIKNNLSQKKIHENMIFFFKCSEKMVFLKKSHWNMIFFVLSGKMIFLVSQKYDIF